jgi:hypothetical protein
MSRLELAIEQIVFARNYTLWLLDGTPEGQWYQQPPAGVSHVAWQVGHLAYAEYRLALLRIRGPQPQDEALFSQDFVRLFGANSVPDTDPAKYVAPAEIRATLNRVHEEAMRELPKLSDAELDQPVPQPHRFAKTKLLALLWCAHHEMLHAGQIGLLRRQLGHAPLW